MASTGATVTQREAMRTAGNIVACYVSNHSVEKGEITTLFQQVYQHLLVLGAEGSTVMPNRDPAVAIDKSVTPDYIICLEDGKRLKMLKRYLRTHYDLSVEEYRRKWGLPADYPMTAPNYAKRRSSLAKKIGLGAAARKSGRKKKAKGRKRAASQKRSAA